MCTFLRKTLKGLLLQWDIKVLLWLSALMLIPLKWRHRHGNRNEFVLKHSHSTLLWNFSDAKSNILMPSKNLFPMNSLTSTIEQATHYITSTNMTQSRKIVRHSIRNSVFLKENKWSQWGEQSNIFIGKETSWDA